MNRNGVMFLLVILCFVISLTESIAAPIVSSVSGTVSDGNSITISGSGFGTHADYGGSQSFLNAAWTNFESGSLNGGNLSINTSYQPVNWSIASSGERVGSSFHAKQQYVSQRLGALSYNQTIQADEWYTTFWFKTTSIDTGSKFWRIYADGPANNIYLATGGGTNTMIRGYSECSSCSPSPATQWSSPNSFVINQWHRVEIIMKRSPDEFRVYLDGVEQWNRISATGDDQWVYPSFNGQGHSIDIGNMSENTGSFNYDDVYIDYTRARIELGNASTWASCTIREIQIPTAWTSNSATIMVNQGSFTGGQTVYLYVLDSSGVVNTNGYPVSIDGGEVVNILNQPVNLRIVN